MAFIVEDGTMVVGANSYASVAYADSYFTDRGIVTWTGANSLKQAALILATDYVEAFKGKFKDTSLGGTLFFPSSNVTGMGAMPSQLLNATCEYALRALVSGNLDSDPTIDATGYPLSELEKTVGPLTTKKKFFNTSTSRVSRFPSADKYLKQLLISSNTVIRG